MTLHDADVFKRVIHSGVSLFRKRIFNICLIVIKVIEGSEKLAPQLRAVELREPEFGFQHSH